MVITWAILSYMEECHCTMVGFRLAEQGFLIHKTIRNIKDEKKEFLKYKLS